MTSRRVVRSRRVVLPRETIAADVVIEAGLIQSIEAHGSTPDADVYDAGTLAVLPGLVDTHVHLNEPGRTEWEGFQSGTAAARAGGVTTLVDMPLNSSPVTTSVEALQAKRAAAKGKLHVDVGFHAGVVPDSAATIGEVIDAGALAAKTFLCHSGIDDFPETREADLRTAMESLSKHGATLLVHAEIVSQVAAMDDPRSYKQYANSRPPSFERNAIALMIKLAKEIVCPIHIVHLADAGCLPMIREARDAGLPLTVETCPHYLFFSDGHIADGVTQFKCAPPIRDEENREGLWRGLSEGLIDFIVSDHSPCPVEMKQLDLGRFDEAWGGISSLQLGLPAVWTEAAKRGMPLEQVVRWMSVEPAKLLNLPQGIAPGSPAHLVVFDPDATWTVDQAKLLHRNPITPYHGFKLKGKVHETFVHGENDGSFHGRLI